MLENATIEISKISLEKLELASAIAYDTTRSNSHKISGTHETTKTKALNSIEIKVNGEVHKINSANVDGFGISLNFKGGDSIMLSVDHISVLLKKFKKMSALDTIMFVNDRG